MAMRNLLFGFVLAVMASSCVTYTKCIDKFAFPQEPVTIIKHDTIRDTVYTTGDSLNGVVPKADSTRQDTTTEVSNSGKLTIKFWYDKYLKAIRYAARQKPDTVYIEKVVEVVVDCPPSVVLDPDKDAPWHRKLWKRFQLFAAWAILAGLIIFICYIKFKSTNTNIYVKKDSSEDHQLPL